MRIVSLLFVVVLAVLCAGCARYPTTEIPNTVPSRTLVSQITVQGVINPAYYYFFALNVGTDPSHGPVPLVTSQALANEWGILSGYGPNDPVLIPPFYVMYHNGSFQQYRAGAPIGPPYIGRVSQDRKTLYVEVDVSLITATGQPAATNVQINWITTNTIIPSPADVGTTKIFDGFGYYGNDYLDTVPLDTARVWQSGVNGVLDEYSGDYNTAGYPDIDMISWQVEVRIR